MPCSIDEAEWTDLKPFIIRGYYPGISTKMSVFERFYTQRPKGATFGNHSGLGLAICRQIITAHHGTMKAENRKGRDGDIMGARFSVYMPRHRP